MNAPTVTRIWAMPSAETFSIPPVRSLVQRYLADSKLSVDPFARSSNLATITNDLDPNTTAQHHLTCEEFAAFLRSTEIVPDLILFDPPYSYRQAVEVYAGVGKEWTNRDQQQVGRWSTTKDILASILAPGGHVISFGWSTTGFGKKRGMRATEYAIINHGSAHNDTLVTVERKSSP